VGRFRPKIGSHGKGRLEVEVYFRLSKSLTGRLLGRGRLYSPHLMGGSTGLSFAQGVVTPGGFYVDVKEKREL